jgi:glutathionyl-hydroquinone reductase
MCLPKRDIRPEFFFCSRLSSNEENKKEKFKTEPLEWEYRNNSIVQNHYDSLIYTFSMIFDLIADSTVVNSSTKM